MCLITSDSGSALKSPVTITGNPSLNSFTLSNIRLTPSRRATTPIWSRCVFNAKYSFPEILSFILCLAAGGSPSADLVGASGYGSEYVQALEEAYRRQAAQQVRSGSSGGGRNSGGGGAQDYNGLFAAAMESGHPKSYIANNYKKFGFTSNSGLYDDYTEWEIAQEEAESGGVTVSQSNLPDYETILNNSSAGAYGPAYGIVLRNVQNMARNSTEEEITGYLLNQLEAGNINEEGIDTILQALNLAG